MADQLKAAAVLVFTVRGNMPRFAAWLRPRYSPIYAFCEQQPMANTLSLLWGVTPVVMPLELGNPERTIARALELLVTQGRLKTGDTTVVITTIATGRQMVDAVEMRTVG
jgi:pyruvate kinase